MCYSHIDFNWFVRLGHDAETQIHYYLNVIIFYKINKLVISIYQTSL